MKPFPATHGYVLLGLLAMLPSQVNLRFGASHPDVLAYLLVELEHLVAKEG